MLYNTNSEKKSNRECHRCSKIVMLLFIGDDNI